MKIYTLKMKNKESRILTQNCYKNLLTMLGQDSAYFIILILSESKDLK